MKRSELLASILLVPIDALAIVGAFWLSYYARVESGALPVSYVLPLHTYMKYALLITAVWLVIFALLGLYSLRSTRRGLNEFSRIAAGVTIGTLTAIAVLFFLHTTFFSRLVVAFAFAASLVLVSAGRILMRLLQRALFRYGIGVRRAIIVGTGQSAQLLATELQSADRGYRILGFVRSGRSRPAKSVKILGGVADLSRLIKRFRPDELIDVDPKLTEAAKLELINLAEDHHLEFRFTSSTVDLSTARVETAAVAGIPVMTLQPTPLEGWGRVIKRTLDLLLTILAAPFVLLASVPIVVAIKIGSRGPVLFRQTRVGKAGRTFTSYKFRSMVADAEAQLPRLRPRNEAAGPVFKIKNDPRITSVGRWLRRTSLDELPQLINVLKGDMSLVGPRPPLPSEVAQYGRLERRRLTIKPGITGPWQVSGRSEVSFDEWVRLDLYYIRNWSLLLDLTILLKTVFVVASRKGAY